MPALQIRSTADLLARLEAELAARRLLLTFRDRAIERDYLRHHVAAHYLWARITALVGAGIFVLFGVMDSQIQPPAIAAAQVDIRLLIVVPFIALVCALSLTRRVQEWGIGVWFYGAIAVALLTATIIGYPALHGGSPPFEQIMVLQIGASVLLGLLFWQAVVINIAVLLPYAVVVASHPQSFRYPYWSLVELIVVGLLCCMGAWFMERRGRREFLARELLKLSAGIDSLTKLANRRRFMEHLELAWRQAAREGKSLCAMMVDLDHFKAYNDHYGHLAGDHCLEQVAGVLADCARRPFDLVSRYGGEEFVLIFYDADEAGMVDMAARVRSRLQQLAIPHAGSLTAGFVTASVGAVCCRPGPGVSSEWLLRAADDALYHAKREGRDQVAVRPANRQLRPAAAEGS